VPDWVDFISYIYVYIYMEISNPCNYLKHPNYEVNHGKTNNKLIRIGENRGIANFNHLKFGDGFWPRV